MDDNFVGLAAVVMTLGIPMALMYTYYRVRKLRTDERLAALARGVNVHMEPELSELGRSRRAGILLTTGALGYIATFGLIVVLTLTSSFILFPSASCRFVDPRMGCEEPKSVQMLLQTSPPL